MDLLRADHAVLEDPGSPDGAVPLCHLGHLVEVHQVDLNGLEDLLKDVGVSDAVEQAVATDDNVIVQVGRIHVNTDDAVADVDVPGGGLRSHLDVLADVELPAVGLDIAADLVEDALGDQGVCPLARQGVDRGLTNRGQHGVDGLQLRGLGQCHGLVLVKQKGGGPKNFWNLPPFNSR